MTDSNGKFSIVLPARAALIADIGTDAVNTATGAKVANRDVLRASLEQVTEQSGGEGHRRTVRRAHRLARRDLVARLPG